MVLRGTDNVFDMFKNLDILSDYVGYENLLTTYSSDLETVTNQVRTYIDSTVNNVVFIGHSLGAAYAQDIVHHLLSSTGNYVPRLQKIVYFNPYILVTQSYKEMKQACLNNHTLRDLIEVNIVNQDYASLLFRSDPYGQVYVIPNLIEPTGVGFIDDSNIGTFLRNSFINYTNHYMDNWSNQYPSGVTEVSPMIHTGATSIRTAISQDFSRWRSATNTNLYIQKQSIVNENLFVGHPRVTDAATNDTNTGDFNFMLTRNTNDEDYILYQDDDENNLLALLYNVTNGSFEMPIFFLRTYYDDTQNINFWGLVTKDVNNNHIYHRLNTANWDTLFATNDSIAISGYQLMNITRTQFESSTNSGNVVNRQRFLLVGGLDPTVYQPRRSLPEALDGNVQLINKRKGGYLLMNANNPPSHYSVQEGNTADNLDGNNANATSPDNSIWTINHVSGTSYYMFTNTVTGVGGFAHNLGDQWFHTQYWRTNANSIWGSQSDYKDALTGDIINNQIYFEHVSHYNSSYNTLDFFLYVMYNNKRQYIVPYQDHAGAPNHTWAYIFLVSEDHFNPDPSSTITIKDYVLNGNGTFTERYNQFVWTFNQVGGSNIATI